MSYLALESYATGRVVPWQQSLEVLETLDEGREEIVLELLVEVCRTDDEERLWELAGFLARTSSTPPLQPLLELLSDPSAEVRRRTAMALGKIGDPGILPGLVSLYLDPIPEVQAEAAEAVWRITGGDDGFEPELAPEEKARILHRWRKSFSR